MDRHAEREVRGGARRGVALAALLLASGCVSSGQLATEAGPTGPPVTRVAALWSNQVMTGVDPLHDGAPMYGLAGRVFLFGPELTENLLADGKLIVELYALVPEQPQGPPVMQGRWEIDKATLSSKCLRKDGFGQGYSMNLPWPSYRPEVTHLDLRVRYEPAKGMPVYTQDAVLLDNGPGPAAPVVSRRAETGDGQPIATAGAPAAAPPAGAQPVSYSMPFPVQPAGGVPPQPVQTFQTPQPLPGAYRR